MSDYRYMAYEENGYYCGQQLLNVEQSSAVIPSLLKMYPVHQSIQVYDRDGQLDACSISIDLDSKEYDKSKRDCEYLIFSIEQHLGVRPEVFFSGNKGFHIIVPYYVKGPRSYLIVKEIVKELGAMCSTIDYQFYKSRSLLRVNKSKASLDGHYKVPVEGKIPSHNEMLEYSRLPKEQRYFCDTSSMDMDLLEEVIEEADKKAKIAEAERKEYANSFYTPMTPCLEKLIDEPRDGERQHSVYVLSKYFKSQGIDEEVCTDMIMDRPHYQEFNDVDLPRNQVVNTIRRVYDTAKYPVGCRGDSVDAELMRSFCGSMCIFNKDVEIEFPSP